MSFFVRKGETQQRLIVDTRVANQHVRRPRHSSLPTAAVWSALEIGPSEQLHVQQVDAATAFYRIKAPHGMSEYFVLPEVQT